MKTLTTLLLTLGICALSLPAFAGPSCDATGEGELNVMDIVAIVDAVLNPDTTSANCAGPGCDECADITSDNADAIAAAMPSCDFEGGEVWDGTGDGVCVCAVDSAVRDCADVCGGDDTSCEGCDGVQNSGLVDDECGVCDGPGATYECGCADIAEGACDCAGNVLDCNDVCGGDAVEDECGVCNGDGESCAPTCYSTDFFDYHVNDICFESVECCVGAGGAVWVDFGDCAFGSVFDLAYQCVSN